MGIGKSIDLSTFHLHKEKLLLYALIYIVVTGSLWVHSVAEYRDRKEHSIRSYQSGIKNVSLILKRSVKSYLDEKYGEKYYSSDINNYEEIEEDIVGEFIKPVRMFESGGAWLYTPEKVIYDKYAGPPESYRGMDVEELFKRYESRGGSGFEKFINKIKSGKEGYADFVRQKESGREVCAWTVLITHGRSWIIGISVPLDEMLEENGENGYFIGRFFRLGVFSIVLLVVMLISLFSDMKKKHIAGELERSELKVQSLIDNMPDGVLLTDVKGKIIKTTKRYEELKGINSKYATGKMLWEIIYDSYPTGQKTKELFHSIKESVQMALKNGKVDNLPVKKEEVTISPSSGKKHVKNTFISIKSGGGYMLCGLAEDISPLKETQKSLEANNSFLEMVFTTINSGIMVIDKDYTVTHSNNAIEKMLTDGKSIVGSKCYVAYYGKTRPCSHCLIQKVEESGRPHENEATFIDAEANKLIRNVKTYPIKDSDGNITSYLEYIHDITDIVKIREEFKKYAFLVNTSEDFMTLIDRNYRYVAANQAYCHAKEKTEDEIIGKSVADLWDEKTFENELKENFDKCFEGETVEYQQWFDFGIKGKRFLSVSYYPFHGTGNIITHAVVVSRDTTEIKLIDEKMKEELERKRRSIAKAQELQQTLNTKLLPHAAGAAIQALYMPCEELGGDFFTVHEAVDEKIIIILADCTGHGMEVAMDSTLLKSLADKHIWILAEMGSPDSFLEQVNIDMIKYASEGQYPTMFVGLIDKERKTLTYANANGELPFLLRKGQVSQLEKVEGIHICFDKAAVFKTKELQLQDDDILFLFSDALIETNGKDGEMLGESRVGEFLKTVSGKPETDIQNLLSYLEGESGSLPLLDDLTFIAIRLSPRRELKYTVKSSNELDEIKKEVEEMLLQYGYSDREIYAVILSLVEGAGNSIEHGNKGDETKNVHISFTLDTEFVEINIKDEGEGFNPEGRPEYDPTSILDQKIEESYLRGRGIWMLNYYMDSVSFKENGTLLKLYRQKEKTFTTFKYFGEREEA